MNAAAPGLRYDAGSPGSSSSPELPRYGSLPHCRGALQPTSGGGSDERERARTSHMKHLYAASPWSGRTGEGYGFRYSGGRNAVDWQF